MKRIAYSPIYLAIMALAACGGGGESGNNDTQVPSMASTAQGNAGAVDSGSSVSTVQANGEAVKESVLMATSTVSYTGPVGQNAADYVPAFTEDFNNGFNTRVWNDHIWYTSSNATKNYQVSNGSLKIWPQRDARGNFFNRTIDTDGHYSQKYGYFEIRAKLPKGNGTWPSFIMLNHDTARRPDIDVMKALGGVAGWSTLGSDGIRRPTAFASAMWTDSSALVGSKQTQTSDLSAAFHTYGLKWEANRQTFYFDGKPVYSVNVSMSDPMYLLLNLWMGGSAGTPDRRTPTGSSNSYEIQYVKTWQFKSTSSTTTPTSTPAPTPAPTPTPTPTPAPSPTPAPTPAPSPTPAPAPAPAPLPSPTPAPAPSPTPAPAPTAVAPYGQDASLYALSFDEEFSSGYNTSLWNDHTWYESSNPTKNYTVENGALKIWPQKDSTGNFFNRTVDTDGKYYQTYGYFEMEAKLPIGKGTWPAFWLFNHIGTRRPEIDMMEAYAGGASPWGTIINGQPHPTMFASTIWKDATSQAGTHKVSTGDLSAAFHKYAIKWEANKQTFYFDGNQIYTVNVSMPDPMYIILDLWYGSASGTPDNTTPTGKTNSYEVNYVRAWKFK